MNKTNDLYTAWADASIGELVLGHPDVFSPYEYVLLTSIDSTTDLRALPLAAEVEQRFPASFTLGTGLVVRATDLLEMTAEREMFTGFDETWWFTEPPRAPKPPEVSLVAPFNVRDEGIPADLARWMQQARPDLGLGDGVGVNIVARTGAIVERIVRLVSMAN